MKMMICENCGGKEFSFKDGYYICEFCKTKYVPEAKDKIRSSDISISDDVKALLEKCEKNPKNAKKYANLVLDIDPLNQEALKYL